MAAGLDKSARLAIFLARLLAAAPGSDAPSAHRLIEQILNEVEDEYTDIPYRPESFATDGRLYAPQGDARRIVPGRPDILAFRNRGHRTYIGGNGAIVIARLDGTIILDKPGSDGVRLEMTW